MSRLRDGFVLHVERHKGHIVRRDGGGQHHAVLVMILLDRGAEQPSHADAVAAHQDEVRLAVLVRIMRIQNIAVARAQLEYVPDFDAAPHHKFFTALFAGVSRLRERDVVNDVRFKVSMVVGIAEVVVGSVRAREEVGTHVNGVVRHHLNAVQTDGRCRTCRESVLPHFFRRCEAETGNASQHIG